MNFRAYYISQSPKSYTSFNLTTRYYMNRQQDYLSFTAGLGTSPDDRSRLIQFPQLAGLLTRSVGAGYQKTFKYRTTVGLFGTWINQKNLLMTIRISMIFILCCSVNFKYVPDDALFIAYDGFVWL